MLSETVVVIFISLIIHSSYSAVTGRWIYPKSAVKPRIIKYGSETSNETDLHEDLLENNMTITARNDSLFWTMPTTQGLVDVEADSGVKLDSDKLDSQLEIMNNTSQDLEDTTELEKNVTSVSSGSTELVQDHETVENQNNAVIYNYPLNSVMDETIVLRRSNCNLEIAVQETHNLKIEIRFGKLQNNSAGKCCITLNGQRNSRLGVLISNIHFHEETSQGEVLKVITSEYGFEFVLKEYHPGTTYQPMLLTETQRVYIVLYYKVTNVPLNEQDSHFNLEVFNYHKTKNYIHHGNSHTELHFPYVKHNHPIKQQFFAPYYYY